jgi:hypothetical protein
MRIGTTKPSRSDSPDDVGTLWTLQRADHTARCALLAWRRGWQVRVLVDREMLLTERCGRTEDAFALAERWKCRLLAEGWTQVLPPQSEGRA